MKLSNLDKTKAITAALVAVVSSVLEKVLSFPYMYLAFGMSGGGLISSILIATLQVMFTALVFAGAYTIITRFVFKSATVKRKELMEMAITTALAAMAFQRLVNLVIGYFMLTTLFVYLIMFTGAYFLIPDTSSTTDEEQGAVLGGQTVYRKEKVIQPGSGAANLLMYVFMFAWGCGIIFTWGGFIVRPRSQAPAFFAIGAVCLMIAISWTMQKINDANIESYKKIVLPTYWPKDCSYEKYHLGLHSKFAKQSGGLFGDKNMKFYNECKSVGIKELNSEYNMQKATLVAQKMNIKDINDALLKQMFEKGESMVTSDAKAAAEASSDNALNAKRVQELNELAENLKFYGLNGIEKRKEMLRALMRKADKNRKEAEMMASMASRTMLQKEHDWATHGGIASGIAGPAAGIATALDIQAKNAVIREQNAKMMPYVAMVSSSYSNTASGYREEYNRYAADLRACNTKLVSTDSKEEVMKNIIIKDAKYTVSTTGAVTVEATFNIDPNYRIFESTKPTIDGCVACRLMQGNECKGSAYFVFPVEGIINNTKLKAICTKTVEPGAEYTLVFEPDAVWAMEKL